ncbi:hypothetical protein CP532_1207 [Ophiocordyceps camponoti-leonardi (nom. inval.)]|nr:hypothetical protein CP532_1207 [Ophiocordyceps camponoti-leonardi (nom. inval.)]
MAHARAYGGNYPGWFEVYTKQLIRHVDAYGMPYWTRRRKRMLPDGADTPVEYFKVSGLLLDLDAEEAKTVRPFRAADELQMRDEWKARSERAAAGAQAKQIRDQIDKWRLSLHKTSLPIPTVWRITPHDVMSAALLGSPASGGPGIGEGSRLKSLCEANGIPQQALADDRQLMRWLLLRRRSSDRQGSTEAVLQPRHLASSLKSQESVRDIRFLVSLSLNRQNQIGSFDKVQARRSAITSLTRQACDRAAVRAGECPSTVLETLTFLGNLHESRGSIGSPLLGLALKLSAQAGELEALSDWLKRFYEARAWNDRKTGKDVQATLDSLVRLLAESGDVPVVERQLLMRLLAGIEEGGQMAPESVRGVLMTYLEGRSESRPFGVYTMYGTYLELLGRLGAGRLLWREWRESAPLAKGMMSTEKEEKKKVWSEKMVDSSFAKAVCQLSTARLTGGERRGERGLEQCAWLDYEAMSEMTWHGGGSVPELERHDDAVKLLELPLDGFVRGVGAIRSKGVVEGE